MIIKALAAHDFRKYAELHLDNLPERGLVAVVGGNESGKSTIGEALQFALFGSTNQVGVNDVTSLIRWGCQQATVILRLLLRGHEYRLTRSVNQDGDVMATLFSTEESITLADTPERVETQLKSLLGYNQKSFGQAFYWSQQSSHSPQDDTDSLLSLAGLKEYARLREQLQAENTERTQAIANQQAQYAATLGDLEALQIDDEHLPHLEKIGNTLETRQQHFLQLAQRIDNETGQYIADHAFFQTLQAHAQQVGFWTRVILFLFVLMLLTGLFLLFAPALGSGLMSENGSLREMLGWATIQVAALMALVGAGLLVYGWYVDMRRIRPLRKQGTVLANALLDGVTANDAPLHEQVDEDAAVYLGESGLIIPERSSEHPDIAAIPEWAKAARNHVTSPQNIQAAADALNVSMESRNREFGTYLQQLHKDTRTEQERLNQREQMQASLAQQHERLEFERRQNIVTHKALDLLQQSSGNSISRFNQLVQRRCSELVEHFTGGHYRQLELMPDFNLRVFSNEKDDFLDFAETSTGTQRQIALAMRVAVANALADTTHTPEQLLFLDEPLAFFDQDRSGNTLKSLDENTHSAVCQIWLTAQALPESVLFAKVIHCPQYGHELAA